MNIVNSCSFTHEEEQYTNYEDLQFDNNQEETDVTSYAPETENIIDFNSEKYILAIMTSLLGKSNLTIKQAIDTILLMKELCQETVQQCILRICGSSSFEEIFQNIENQPIFKFEELESEYKIKA